MGRRTELARFTEALAGRSARRVFLVHSVGGIGKTTLLLEFRARARAAGRTALLIDGRDVDLSPEGLTAAIAHELKRSDLHVDTVGEVSGVTLLVDHYEQLTPVDGWVRDRLLPQLPADGIAVLAGRHTPSAEWRRTAGWRDVVAVLRLDTLEELDRKEFLRRTGLPAPLHPRLAALSHGHPLALALLADIAADGDVPAALADAPDLVAALLEAVVSAVPTEAHAVGLATCSGAWSTTEHLLEKTVGPGAARVWDWLASQPFVARGARGLILHDLAREVLDAEFERRSPERHHRLHRVIHDHVVAEVRATSGFDRQHSAQQLLFLHRRSPLTSTFWQLRARGSAAVVPARPADYPQALAIIERFEGPASADLARDWFTDAPQGMSVVREGDGIAAFAFGVLHPTGSGLEERDPAVRAALDFALRTSPARPGEHIDVSRFRGGRHDYERDPYAVLAVSVSALIEWLIRPLAWSFTVTSDPEVWGPFFDYLAFTRVAEVEVGGQTRVVYGTDWRRLGVDAWMTLMNEREISGGSGPPPAHLLRPAPLDRGRFTEAIRDALRDLQSDNRLAANALMGSSLALGPDGAVPQALRRTIERAIDALGRRPRGAGLRRVLDRTFVHAAPTQEAAAEVLDLPFSTYRRHLSAALSELTDLLWAVEIGEVRLPTQPQSEVPAEH